jgi:hypothetical protein
MATEKSDKEKGKDILKAREKASKGLEPGAPDDAMEETRQREEKKRAEWLGVGLGAKRSG